MATSDISDTTIYYERTGGGPAVGVRARRVRRRRGLGRPGPALFDRYTCCATTAVATAAATEARAAITDAVHADDAAALIEGLSLAPCLLAGSSGGAAIAIDVAQRYGHLLGGAVFSEPPLFLDRAAGRTVTEELARPSRRPPRPEGPERPSTRSSRSSVPVCVAHPRVPQGPLPR